MESLQHGLSTPVTGAWRSLLLLRSPRALAAQPLVLPAVPDACVLQGKAGKCCGSKPRCKNCPARRKK
ncbi:hypothetical protein CLD22_30175 [Rubrivivax gelatinosus]|nr:hypothetical protein [Rubrivivax gelatinosus]